MTATLPATLTTGQDPSGTSMSQMLVALTALTNIGSLWTIGGVGFSGFTGASYTNIVSTPFSWTKAGSASASNVGFMMIAGWRANASVPTAAKFGVNIGGTDYDVVYHEQTANAGAHQITTGFRIITGIPAGAYTVQLRILRAAGTGSLQSDGSDTYSIVVGEIPL